MIQDPYFWTFITGCSLGFGFSVLTRLRTFRTRRFTIASFAASVAIICAFVGAFVSGPANLTDLGLAYALGAITLVSGVGFRFPRTAGIPLLILFCVCVGFVLVAIQPWSTFEYNTPIAAFSVQTEPNDVLRVEFRSDGEVYSERYPAQEFEIVAELLSAPGYWFFVGQFARIRRSEDTFRNVSAKIGSIIPGWTTATVSSGWIQPRELYEYFVSITPDGSVQIELSVPGK